ncbi:DUF5681 domain-containing protein [Altererythrobacter sp. MF3-039]|uniref:DUF5681 domain-containing protein n=1 Tax=Altererythrobacter sp. MF3-039 TaxID=3252901 RepID=UPI00390CAE37
MSYQELIGYGNPPASTRFKKGQSGNPRGRPKKRHREMPYDAVLGQMVTIRENGKEKRVTAAEAFLLQLTRKGLAGDSAAARASLEAIEAARAKRTDTAAPLRLRWVLVGMGVGCAIKKLGIAQKKYPYDENRVRFELNPWIVEAALERLGERRLTLDEQREVFANTRTPYKVNWPEWWDVKS